MNALSDYLMKSGREEAGVLLGAYLRSIRMLVQVDVLHNRVVDITENPG